MSERESMEFDVVIVGAGPAGLSAACRLRQLAIEKERDLTVCVVEKGSEVGAHILSGAVLESRALDELFPDWRERKAPMGCPVTAEQTYMLLNSSKGVRLPSLFVPKTMHNHGNWIGSVGSLSRWLAEQAEELGTEIFPGFPAADVLYDGDGNVLGIITGDMGVGADGQPKDSYTPGMELRAKYTLFAEGSRGHLARNLEEHFNLDANADAQHYGIGIKELWNVPAASHQQGLVLHGAGWPLGSTGGGFFVYHMENNQVAVGITVDLNYTNPYLSPFDEFQRLKHHPVIAKMLKGGERVAYGARAITKGGFNALPRMIFPGGLLIGCNAGTLNFAKIKGVHTAMKGAMIAAETVFDGLCRELPATEQLHDFKRNFENSWVYEELKRTRNFGPAMHKWGTLVGGTFNFIDQNIFNGRLPFTLHDNHPDFAGLKPLSLAQPIHYPKPDGQLSFDKLSSVYLSNTVHEEDQPCHLHLQDPDVPVQINLPQYGAPAERYCPAGVYEIVDRDSSEPRFQINASNCLHCKTCDIKDPSQNIIWVTPEGGGGPNYPNM